MFEQLRQSFRDLLGSAASPEDRRDALARMRDTLVQAKVGVADLRSGVDETRRRLAAERRELETVRRRKTLAAGVPDPETVAIAERYEQQHLERVRVLEAKLAAQESELSLAESEIGVMSAELRSAMSGAGMPLRTPSLESEDPLRVDEIEHMSRERQRAEREEEAARRLEALKRRMGK